MLYRNRGDGTFEDVSEASGIAHPRGPASMVFVPSNWRPSGSYGMGAASADLDNDGWPDIYVACDTAPSLLYRNNHDGTFREVAIPAGVAFDETPTIDATRTPRVPDGDRTWGSIGIGYQVSDRMKIDAAFLHIWVDDGKMEPIDELATENGWADAFPKAVLDSVTRDGKLYAVPVNIERDNNLYYSVSLLDEQGITPPATLDDFYDACESLKEADIVPLAVPYTLGNVGDTALADQPVRVELRPAASEDVLAEQSFDVDLPAHEEISGRTSLATSAVPPGRYRVLLLAWLPDQGGAWTMLDTAAIEIGPAGCSHDPDVLFANGFEAPADPDLLRRLRSPLRPPGAPRHVFRRRCSRACRTWRATRSQ